MANKKEVKLLPCSICGAPAKRHTGSKIDYSSIICSNKHCPLQIAIEDIAEDGVLWNTIAQRSIDSHYDSRKDTLLHIKRVSELLSNAAIELLNRAKIHDDSKLSDIERHIFDVYTPKLKGSTYGSKKYYGFLKDMRVALDHHYTANRHHPEHFKNGIDDMNLFDLLELFMDWKAAGERHADGNIFKSIKKNKDRFKISDQLVKIFTNTAYSLGYKK